MDIRYSKLDISPIYVTLITTLPPSLGNIRFLEGLKSVYNCLDPRELLKCLKRLHLLYLGMQCKHIGLSLIRTICTLLFFVNISIATSCNKYLLEWTSAIRSIGIIFCFLCSM